MKSFSLTLTGLILLAFGVWMSLINQGLVGGYGAFIDSEPGQGTIQAAGDFPDVLDGDGIQPEIDGRLDNLLFIDQSTIFSNDFTDQHIGGTSFGSIVNRGGLLITVDELANPLGMAVKAFGDAGLQADTILCGTPTQFGAGADFVIDFCGSLGIQVLVGPIEVSPTPDVVVTVPDNTTATVTTLPDGEVQVVNSPDSLGTIEVSPAPDVVVTITSDSTAAITALPDGQVVVENSGQGTVVVDVDGVEITLGPGDVIATTPRGRKELALERLTPYSEESDRIEKAIEEINKSLEKGWVDDAHLDPKDGKKVFDREQKAVKELLKVVKDEEEGEVEVSAAAVAAVLAAIDDLVTADRLLAVTALDELSGTVAEDPDRQDKVDRELEKGLEELDKGDEELVKGKPDKAIDKFKKAWEHAVKAAKEAAKAPDDDDSSDDNSSDDDSSDEGSSSDDDSKDSGDDD